MNREQAAIRDSDSRLKARIANVELAATMQLSAPQAVDLSRETTETHAADGLDQRITEDDSPPCLVVRRLIARGRRFVQVWSDLQGAVIHRNNHGNISTVSPPITASATL